MHLEIGTGKEGLQKAAAQLARIAFEEEAASGNGSSIVGCVEKVVDKTLGRLKNRDLVAGLREALIRLVCEKLHELEQGFHERFVNALAPMVKQPDTPVGAPDAAEKGDNDDALNQFDMAQFYKVLSGVAPDCSVGIEDLFTQRGIQTVAELRRQYPGSAIPSLGLPEGSGQAIIETLGKLRRVLNESLVELHLSGRAWTRCQHLGVLTIGQLVSRSADEILNAQDDAGKPLTGFGPTSLKEIQSRLKERGLHLKGEI